VNVDSLEQMYQEVILSESKHPYNKVYEIEDPNKSHQFNPSCGDDITLSVQTTGDAIDQITFSGEGCSISISSASILAKMLEHKTVAEALKLADLFTKLMNSRGAGLGDDEMDELGDASVFVGTSKFPARIKCALLGWAAFRGALQNQGVASAFSSHSSSDSSSDSAA
jgi:nitrogen fixation NifU-like protein